MCTERPVAEDANANSGADEEVTIVVLCVVYLLHHAGDDARRLE